MTKTKNQVAASVVCTTNRLPKRMNRPIAPPSFVGDNREIIERPGHCIGRLLALQQLDGVDGSTQQLFKGQFDDAFGTVDPVTDIHQDRHILQDALLQRQIQSKMTNE